MLPLIVAALVVPAFAAFALGGAGAGTAVGFLTIAGLILLAARTRPRDPIEFRGDRAGAPLLALALAPIDDATTANRIATMAEAGPDPDRHAVLVLAPVLSTPLQRWLSDEGPGRIAAQERLAVSIATLAAAGCHAEGRVVSENPGEALEDVAAQQGAARIVFVVVDRRYDRLIADLTERLDRPVHRVEAVPGPGAPGFA
jgi:hypothetical protein